MSKLVIAEKTLSEKNPLQKYLSQRRGNDAELYSHFFNGDFPKSSRTVRYDLKMEPELNSEYFTFKVPEKWHFLTTSDFMQALPEVKVKDEFKDEYQISWTPKTCLCMIKSVQFFQGEEPIGEALTGESIDMMIEFLEERFFHQKYDEIIFNLQGETEWSTVLPQKTLIVPQPFFYTATQLHALKRCLTPTAKFSHRYSLRRQLIDLLRIQHLENGEWVYCDKSEIIEKCVFSKATPDWDLATPPELWGDFGLTNPEEMDDWKDILATKKYLGSFQELVRIPYESASAGAETIRIEITTEGLVRGIFWCLRNTSEIDNNNYYVYDENDSDPIVHTSLSSDGKYQWEEMASVHHSRRLPRHARLRTPNTIGYHYHPFVFDGVMTDGADTHVDLKSLKSVFVIKVMKYKSKKTMLPMIFLDMHRVLEYSSGELKIHVNTDPDNTSKEST